MDKEKKQNNLAAFLASRTGRKFFNMLYSFGASIVIIGALAKIIHLPFGNELLVIGMVTEAFVFAISAFDNDQVDYEESPQAGGVAVIGGTGGATGTVGGEGGGSVNGVSGFAGGNIVLGNTGPYDPSKFSPEYVEHMDNAAKGMEEFGKVILTLNDVTQSLLGSYKTISDSTQGVSANSVGFSENIKNLNDHVTNINAVYEAQMQSIADQMNTIKYINESLERIRSLYDNTVMDSSAFKQENEKMTRQIQELNKVYARLLQAMNAGGGGGYNPTI